MEHTHLDVGERHGAGGNPGIIMFVGVIGCREEAVLGLVAARRGGARRSDVRSVRSIWSSRVRCIMLDAPAARLAAAAAPVRHGPPAERGTSRGRRWYPRRDGRGATSAMAMEDQGGAPGRRRKNFYVSVWPKITQRR